MLLERQRCLVAPEALPTCLLSPCSSTRTSTMCWLAWRSSTGATRSQSRPSPGACSPALSGRLAEGVVEGGVVSSRARSWGRACSFLEDQGRAVSALPWGFGLSVLRGTG